MKTIINKRIIIIKKDILKKLTNVLGAGEMTYYLRVLSVLTEDQSSIFTIHNKHKIVNYFKNCIGKVSPHTLPKGDSSIFPDPRL